jgi:peroxiredoxin (alkyl hydroperoxide reductase subunit C)
MDYELMMNGNVKLGQKAPDFDAVTTFGNISLKDYKGKWLILFSHPGDFTPVCTTEMIAFTRAHTYFKNLNTELLGLSIDSNPSHLAWIYDIYCRTGIKISFPIIADRSGEIARKYGMISNDISSTETVRNVFVIDDKGIVRTILIYPMNIGRFIPEIIRIVHALQMADCSNGSTAANWLPNQPVIVPIPKTYEQLEDKVEEINKNRNGINWYLSFKEPTEECIKKLENENKIEK